jgi:hypothetical protein
MDEDLQDTRTSPMKIPDIDMDDSDPDDTGAKRMFFLDGKDHEEEVMDQSVVANNIVAPMIADGAVDVTAKEGDNNRTKRLKKDGANSTSLGSASSQEGLVRSQ